MAKRKKAQGEVLERHRGDLSKIEFCAAVGISRPTYDAWLNGAEISLKFLSFLAVDHMDDWRGQLAVELIKLIDERMVPCVCETALWDNGSCPRHGQAHWVGDVAVPLDAVLCNAGVES